MIRVFIPQDSAAKAVGAEKLAAAIHAEITRRGYSDRVEVIRNSSRGLFFLEPLIEVETHGIRHGYGPAHVEDVPSLFDAGFLEAKPHRLALGPIEQIDFLQRQQRFTFANAGRSNPLDLGAFRASGGFRGLANCLSIGPAETVETVLQSGLRGRGGAGFPTGLKWKTAAAAKAAQKYIVCNADEGDSGTFADRMVMEGDPFTLIEGMTIAGIATGATQGYCYIRSEYPDAIRMMAAAISLARAEKLLGTRVNGSVHAFDIEIRVGAGAYVCGEETALLESIEGKRGQVRAKPPVPALQGLFGQPTIINNVLTLASVPWILAHGAKAYQEVGFGKSRGTMPIQLAGNIKRGGLFETGFGITLGELVNDVGGGTATGRAVKAVQVGGPLGAYLHPGQFDVPFDYESYAAKDALIGHGGVVVFDDKADMAAMARFAFEFCTIESCGKCTPCRIGSTRGRATVEKIMAGVDVAANLRLIEDLCQTMKLGSLCALGGFTPYPVLSAIKNWPEDFVPRTPLPSGRGAGVRVHTGEFAA
jgi:formate dehydrogenase iron-sulfur subunit